MSDIMELKKVGKNFKENVALNEVTFHMEEGEIFGLLGPSGAGKTTVIKLMTAQLLPSHGEVMVFGREAYKNKKFLFDHIGILSDNSGLYERLSVWDNLMLFAEIKNVPKKSIMDLLERVDLLTAAKNEAGKLSKGMKQRLMVARAILHKPRLLFLDEPTSSLDPGTALEIHGLLRKLNSEGTTIFLTTHNMEEADKLCDRVGFLNQGSIVEIGNPESLKLKYSNHEIKVILRDHPEKIIIKNNGDNGIKIKEWMEQGVLLSVHSLEPNLETIFLKLTGRGL